MAHTYSKVLASLFMVGVLALGMPAWCQQGDGLSAEERADSARYHAAWERHEKLPPTIQSLKQLKSKDLSVRRKAIASLNKLEPDFNTELFETIGAALTRALEDKDPVVGDGAVQVFTRIRCGSYPPNDRLVELLDSPRPEVVRRAMVVLRTNESHSMQGADGVTLLEKPNATSADRLKGIALMLKAGGCTGYELSLIMRTCSDPSPEVRIAALNTLGKAQCAGAAFTFKRLANDSDPEVRCAALQAMHDTLNDRFGHTLRAAVSDPDPMVSKLAKRLSKDFSGEGRQGNSDEGSEGRRYYDLKLGDLKLTGIGSSAEYDPERGLYFAMGGECDGAVKWIVLASEPGAPHVVEALRDAVDAPIGDIKTGKGIGLGDSRERVQKVLGKPYKVKKDHGRTLEIYRSGRGTMGYQATYSYRNGRLVGILLEENSDEC